MPADPQRVESVFNAALAVPSADQPALLAAECGDDADLRARVERLLAAHQQLGDPATADLPSDPPTATSGGADNAPQPAAGAVIGGRYKLVEEVGHGGMGTVWMARQTDPVKRLVAVKLVKAGMDSRAVLARFEAERQALALMDHPNIAKVLDAGATPDGRPFFVMELVKGVPITAFCDARKLTPRERLELFVPVCNAIQHAHQKGVIHRDIKPNNVLVALYDDRPVPKVIDFGVAKAAGQPLTEHTLATGLGAVVGTPEYMSPEQASLKNLDVDTRSDVYSLGVLLYELLAGSPPFSRNELARVGLLEIFRAIREQEPPRPSTRLSTAYALPTLSANRGTEPKRLTALLRGELDWIVMKALEKDRNRRYPTAIGFAADVQSYLAGEPVQAVPPSAGYRLRKFVRRNRTAVVVAATFLALVLGGAGGVYAAYRRAVAAEADARTEQGKAEDARQAEAVQRRAAERTAASLAVDVDLVEYVHDHRVGLLRLARTHRGLPAECQDLREFATVAVLAGGQEYARLRPPITHDGHAVEEHRLSPDARTLLTRGTDGTARLWDVATGRPLAFLREGDERVRVAGFVPKGDAAFTVDGTGDIRMWDAPGGGLRSVIRPPKDRGAPLFCLYPLIQPSAWIFSGDRMITWREGRDSRNNRERPVELWDSRTGRLVARLDEPGVDPSGLRFTPDGRWITNQVLWSDDRLTVRVYSPEDGRLLARLEHRPPGRSVDVAGTPDGRRLVTLCKPRKAEGDGRVHIWDTATWQSVLSAPLPRRYCGGYIRFLTDNLCILKYEVDGASLFRIGAGEPVFLHEGDVEPRTDHGGRSAYIGSGNVIGLDDGRRLVPPPGRRFHPELSRFAPDGRYATGYENFYYYSGSNLIDTHADKLVAVNWAGDGYLPGVGFVGEQGPSREGLISRGVDWGVELRLVRTAGLDVASDLLELWVQVAVRGELGPDGLFAKWDEPTWERKRQELAARPAPWPDFPFPGHVATDRLHWLRQEFIHASDTADQLRLAGELLRRAEAVGDQIEAVRWRAEIAKRTREVAPPPRAVTR